MNKAVKSVAIHWGLPFLGAAAVWSIGLLSDPTQVSERMASCAVVLAGFSVAAFNLRFRMLDSIQKMDLKQSQVDHLTNVFADCRRNIDKCLILFVLTTVLLLAGKFASGAPPKFSLPVTAFGGFFFLRSIVRFLEILRALRQLEDFSLSMMRRAAKTL